ncbi:IS5 family transposase [Streptomyces sp. NBC_01431]|nr:IS5 family transposase [Streptomyces sp. NBC_01431]
MECPTSPAVGRGDLTNDQWARLEPLLPLGKKPGRPPVWTRRQLIDGIRWRTRTGAPWRDVPERYGPWDRAYDLFRRWQRDGTWKRIFEQPQAEADVKGLMTWDVSVDSTIAPAHQHAAGARKKGAAEGASQRRRHRTRRSRPGTLARRADYQAAPGG